MRKRVYRSVRIEGCEIVRFMEAHLTRSKEGRGSPSFRPGLAGALEPPTWASQIRRLSNGWLLPAAPGVALAIDASDNGASVLAEPGGRGAPRIQPGPSSFAPRDDLEPGDG